MADDSKIKEPVEPQQAPNTGAGPAMSKDVAEHEQERLEQQEEAVERREQKGELVERRELRKLAVHTPKEDIRRLEDTAKHEQERLEQQEEASKLLEERKAERSRMPIRDGAVDSEDIEIKLEPEDEDQRRFTINVHVYGEVDDGYIGIYERDPILDDWKKGRVYESTRFGTKNRLRAELDLSKDKPKMGKTSTILGHFQTTPIRLPAGEYRGRVETVGGKVLETFDFVLLGAAVDATGEPVDQTDPTAHNKELAAKSEERLATERERYAEDARKVAKKAPAATRQARRTQRTAKRQGSK